MTTTTRAIIYARYSPRPGEAEDITSNAKQIDRCRQYAEEKRYEVAGVFQDEALTGLDKEQDPDPTKSILKRPGLLAAIAATKKGMVLVVRWRNRIARDSYVQGWARRQVGKQGGRIESADEANLDGLAGELLDSTLATIDKYRAIQIGIDTALAMQKHQDSGRRMTRADRIPFGKRVDVRDAARILDDPEEQKTIRMIMERYAAGLGTTAICRYLDKRARDRRGKNWTKGQGTVRKVISRQTRPETP